MNPLFLRRSGRNRIVPEFVPSEESLAPQIEQEKTIDYILVYKKSVINEDSYAKIETFVINLEHKGFVLESDTYSVNDNINFVKIHAPRSILLHFADIFRIDLAFQNVDFKPPATTPWKCMATELIIPEMGTRVYEVATALYDRDCPPDFTTAEKNLIIYKVLLNNAFGNKRYELGVEKLIQKGILEDAFPLHDGDYQWPTDEEENTNDRQLLLRYWAAFSCWRKQQPLDLIERYFGSEIALYFAWLGHYNRMLMIASGVGLACFILGISTFKFTFGLRSNEVCASPKILCPRCHEEKCKYEYVNSSCIYAQLLQFFDNPLTVAFAALMSLWGILTANSLLCSGTFLLDRLARQITRLDFIIIINESSTLYSYVSNNCSFKATLFLELWRRQESILQMRWNLRRVETDMSMRPEFEEQTKYRTLSPITGKVEPYMPIHILCYRYTITYSVVILLIVLMTVGIFGVMLYIKAISVMLTREVSDKVVSKNVGLIATATGSLISIVFIVIFERAYHRIAKFLTNLENPRTQIDYDNSYTYKSYAMAFINNYAVIFYIAFFKGRFYTYPGDEEVWNQLLGIGADVCDPAGCIIDLGIQLVICLVLKNLGVTFFQFVYPKVRIRICQFLTSKKLVKISVEHRWEKDFLLNDTPKYQLMTEYMQMVIQYGFVIFFVAAFPLAPLVALINNVFELRVDAQKIIKDYRRPVALKVANLGAWNGILHAVTYIGVATNAIVIAFTSEFIQREVYRYRYNTSLGGFFDSTLSPYDISEFEVNFTTSIDDDYCYYPGKRYPPTHPERYNLTDEYWYDFTAKIFAIVVIEHVFMLTSGILAYAIPDIPFSVKEQLNHQRDNFKELRKRALNDKYLRKRRGEKKDIFTDI